MKCRRLGFLFALAFLTALPLCALGVSDRFYKTIVIDGEKVDRALIVYDITLYNKDGNVTFCQNWRNGTVVNEYDTKGRKIHSSKVAGMSKEEFWWEYGPDGNMIRYLIKVPDGEITEWYEYDSKGHVIHIKNTEGGELRDEYDSKGNLIHRKIRNGTEEWNEYDSKGNLLKKRFADGTFAVIEYDSKGNQIYAKDVDGQEVWVEYDSKNRAVHMRFAPGGNEKWFEYDSKGNLIHEKWTLDDYEAWTQYDSKGHEIYVKYSAGAEYWMEYEFYPNGKVKSKTTYFIMNEM